MNFCRRTRRRTALAALAATALAGARLEANSPLVTYAAAARNGLTRAWFAQVPVDANRSRVTTWYLYFDRIYAVTDSGILAALDSETGALLWSKQVGKPGVPAFGPGANENYVGIVSGITLFMLDRHDGRLIWSRELGSAPSSGPALSHNYAYVALVTGRVEGYKLDDPVAQPWYYQSKGRTYLRPTTTGRVVSWPTVEGNLYVTEADKPGAHLFRLETGNDIVTSPAEQEPNIYIASLDGYLYCLDESSGLESWRYSTGFAITSSPAIVGDHAYVASLEPSLHAVDAAHGQELWAATGVSNFAAQGKSRVYASDRYGNLMMLDLKTGRLLGKIDAGEDLRTLVNDQSDRIFLVSDRGLVQCLHEIGADKPTMYRQPLAATPPPTAPGRAKPAGEKSPETGPSTGRPAGEKPAGPQQPANPAQEPANPFATDAAAPESSKLAGVWLGPLKAGPTELRLALKISVDDVGKMSAKMDSIDQGSKDIPVDSITFAGGTLTAELKIIGGKFVGKFNEKQQSLVGTWTQGPNSLPLTLKKAEGDSQSKRPQEEPAEKRAEPATNENPFG